MGTKTEITLHQFQQNIKKNTKTIFRNQIMEVLQKKKNGNTFLRN